MQNNDRTITLTIYAAFVIVGLIVVAFILNLGGIVTSRPETFSDRNMLSALWYQYKLDYLEPGTSRSLDKQRQNVTTSEGQSYTLLRAAWMDDKQTFDAAWQWTKDNLQRKQDHLMSWLFGQRPDGSYGILVSQGGYNTASDADEDIALALLFASRRWNDQHYYGDAILIIKDIWNKEVETIRGRPYLLANDVEKTLGKPMAVMNPSYLSPYAYHEFARADSSHDWLAVASSSFDVISRSMDMTLGSPRSTGLPPNWVLIDKRTGALSAPNASTGLTTDFGFDAMRVPWRLALDWRWFGDPAAKALLDRMGALGDEWRSSGAIPSVQSHTGQAISAPAPSVYGGTLGYFLASDPTDGEAIYRTKLEALYDPNESKWLRPLGYYDENWAWFGIAMHAGMLDDLYNPALYDKAL